MRSESLTLRLGDALGARGLRALPDRSIASAIFDPPFDARAHRAALEGGAGWRAAGRRVGMRLPFAPLGVAEIQHAAEQLGRLVRRWCVVICGERQTDPWAYALEQAGLRFVRLGAALRTNPRPMMTGRGPAPGFDPIVIAHSAAAMRWNGGGHPGVWEAPAARFDNPKRKRLHPTQKPLHLVRALVQEFSDAGELVLDPFAGSGTTAVACRELGRRFIGWELSADYHAVAIARIAGAAAAQARALELADVGQAAEASTRPKPSTCARCQRPLPLGARSHARYHRSCRELAYRERKRAGS